MSTHPAQTSLSSRAMNAARIIGIPLADLRAIAMAKAIHEIETTGEITLRKCDGLKSPFEWLPEGSALVVGGGDRMPLDFLPSRTRKGLYRMAEETGEDVSDLAARVLREGLAIMKERTKP